MGPFSYLHSGLPEISGVWILPYCIGDFFFTPVASETLGSWGESSLIFLKDLGSRLAGVTGDKRETSWLFQRLSIAIQRGNAISISATIPSPKQLDLFDPV